MIDAPHPLLDRVMVLVDQLRRRGIDVTTGAVIDAAAALTHLPLDEPNSLKAGLRATLVKSSDPTGEFERAFRVVFGGLGRSAVTAADSDDQAPIAATPSELSGALMQAMQRGDELEIALLAQQAVDAFAGFEDEQAHSERYYLYRVMRAIDLSRMLSAAMQQLRREGELTELELMLARNEFAELLDQFRRRLAAEIAARMAEGHDRHHFDVDIGSGVADRDLLQLSALELSELRRVIQPLARQLAARISSHRRLRSTGRLDPRRTVRRSLQSGGVPLDVVMRRRHPHRPELVVLCDVSGSVAEFAQFTFTLVHALHDELRRVRSFAFVDGIAEVTDLFESAQHEIHVNRFVERRGVLGDDGHSDYGRALTRFVEHHLTDAVSPRSTVIICGDARTNYRPDGVDALKAIAAQARRVFWLNPEPETEWGATDSAMDDYRAHCRGAYEVRSLRQLGDVIAALV